MEGLNKTHTTDDIFHPVHLDSARTDIEIGVTNRVDDLGKTDIIRSKCIGVDVDLVFFDKPADRGHLGNAVRPLQRIADVPVLDATDLVQIPAASWIAIRVTAFERIPENLSQGGRIRSQGGRNIVR